MVPQKQRACLLLIIKLQLNSWGDAGVKTRNLARILFLTALTIGLYWPAIRWLGKAWIENDYYNHGFFLLAVSLLLVWFARNRIRQAPISGQKTGLPALLIAGSLYVTGFVLHQPVVLSFSLLLFILSLCWQFLGTAKTWPILFPVLLLGLAIPLPSFSEFGVTLQDWSASGADGLADLFGMDASSNGNIITIGEESYEVAPACSGLNRIMPLFSLTAILVYLLEGHLWKKSLLMALVIPVALASNIFRITVTLAVGSHYGIDTALGFFHDFSSVVLFVVAVGIIILIAFLLRMLKFRKEALL